jgi:hypothetical protein
MLHKAKGHYDGLFAPTTAGACGCDCVSGSVMSASDEGVGPSEQLLRVPNRIDSPGTLITG